MNWLKEILSARSGRLSSKRVCGAMGWLFIVAILVYCTIAGVQAPVFIDTFMLCCMGLLGIDSVTSIWDTKDKSINHNLKNEDNE